MVTAVDLFVFADGNAEILHLFFKKTCKKHFCRVTYTDEYYFVNKIRGKFAVDLMERKTVSQAQIYVRDAVNRAAQQAGMRDYAGAVKTLLPVIKRNLDIPLLFEKIRDYEMSKLKNQDKSAKFSAVMSSIFTLPVISIVAMFDPLKAMQMCETSLANYVDNPAVLNVLASVSEKAGAPWGVVSALKTFCKLHPGNADYHSLKYSFYSIFFPIKQALCIINTLFK